MGRRGALAAIGDWHTVLPLRCAEVAGRHGGGPLGEAAGNEQRAQGQGFPHGGARAVEAVEGDPEVPQAKGCADALVEQVAGQDIVQVLRGEGGLLQRLAQRGLLHGALRLLPCFLPEEAVLAQVVEVGAQRAIPLLPAANGGVGEDDAGPRKGDGLPP